MTPKTRIQLSSMMFLQFFIWGAWFVTLGTYLGRGLNLDGVSIGAAYSTMPWGALIAPFFIGMIADRFFNSERVLAVCHILGAAILYYASTVVDPGLLFWVLLAYALAYNPTLALVNAISFNQIDNVEKQFPMIRVFGTIGWIVAGILVGSLGIEATANPMRIAAGASLLLGILSFFLPKTPPKSKESGVSISGILGLDALALLKDKSFAVFTLGSLLLCIPLAFYYNFTNLFLNDMGVENAAGKMTMGQMSEIVFMLVMPFFFVRLGVKKMLLAGMIGWVLRYVLFAFGDPGGLVWMFYLGILLHGICYDFFFVTGQIYVDKAAGEKIRASAQGFITLITYGLGMLIGAWASGLIVKSFETTDPVGEILRNWSDIWLIPAAMAAVVIVLFAIFFKPTETSAEK
ncbi:MAG: nucleoside permease [Verrucomicrobiota bacterium]